MSRCLGMRTMQEEEEEEEVSAIRRYQDAYGGIRYEDV